MIFEDWYDGPDMRELDFQSPSRPQPAGGFSPVELGAYENYETSPTAVAELEIPQDIPFSKGFEDEPQFNQGDPTNVGDVVVYGSRYSRFVGWSAAGSGPSDQGWEGNDSDQFVFTPNWGCTGAPNGQAPDDHTMVRVRLIAQQIAAQLDNPALNQNWEWGALIYVTADNHMYHTDLFSVRSSGGISFPLNDPGFLPDGATIVGWVHSHPYIYGEPDQNGLSDVDSRAFQTFTNNANGRYTVSSDLMTYVFNQSGSRLTEFDEGDGEGDSGKRVITCGT